MNPISNPGARSRTDRPSRVSSLSRRNPNSAASIEPTTASTTASPIAQKTIHTPRNTAST